jgi:hypothetical protein
MCEGTGKDNNEVKDGVNPDGSDASPEPSGLTPSSFFDLIVFFACPIA